MARPRKFDEGEALQKIMMVFWRHGYEATTYKMLEDATGIGVRGLANVFGDKDAIFLKTLQMYTGMVTGMLEQLFAKPGLPAIEAFFEAMVVPTEDPEDITNAGCLMVNTVFEIGKIDAPVREVVDNYRKIFINHFEACLRHESLPDVEAKAEFLLGVLWGILSHIRLAGSNRSAAPMAHVAINTIRSWRQ